MYFVLFFQKTSIFKMVFNVPDEILLKIFTKLTQKQLFLNVAFVNKQFNMVSKDPSLLKVLTLENIDEYVFDSLETLLQSATKIEKLIIKDSILNLNHLIELALKTSKVLKTIRIETKLTVNLAKVLSQHGKCLEHLDLKKCRLEKNNEVIIYMKNMENLKIIKCPTSLKPDKFLHIISGNRKLEEVTLPNIENSSNDFLNNIFDSLKDTLTKLEFTSLESLKWDFKALEHAEKLSQLMMRLTGVPLDTSQISNLGKIANLKSFWLQNNRACLSDQIQGRNGLINLFRNLPITKLERFGFSYQCYHKPINIFRLIIGRLGRNLKILSLKCIKDTCLRNCPKIETLTIEDVKTVLGNCPNLEELEIDGQNLPEQFLCEIEYKFNLKLCLPRYKSVSVRRFKTFNPRFFEQMTYF